MRAPLRANGDTMARRKLGRLRLNGRMATRLQWFRSGQMHRMTCIELRSTRRRSVFYESRSDASRAVHARLRLQYSDHRNDGVAVGTNTANFESVPEGEGEAPTSLGLPPTGSTESRPPEKRLYEADSWCGLAHRSDRAGDPGLMRRENHNQMSGNRGAQQHG